MEDFSSKLDLPRTLETVESIDANHMQMTRYSSKDDQGYRAISSVLKRFVRQELESTIIPPANPTDVSCTYLENVDNELLQRSTLTNVVLPATGALFIVPFSRDDLFVGREDIIAKISEKRKQTVSRNHTRLALVGLGGVG